ncbi:MAG: hypothetical protein EOP45_07230, partial [Sphingobacteriaceae bacterium]
MSFTCSCVKVRPSNFKQTQYNANNKENPRIVITLNESHLTKYIPQGRNRKRKVVHEFHNKETGLKIDELPIRIWITPDNSLYQLLNDDQNKTIDAWFELDISKSWGSFYDVTRWTISERLDHVPSQTQMDQIGYKSPIIESKEEKLARIADKGFERIFEAHPKFLQKVKQWHRTINDSSFTTTTPAVHPCNV